MKKIYLTTLLVLLISTCVLSKNKIEVKVIFDNIEPNIVLLSHSGNSGWDTYEMTKVSNKVFIYAGDVKSSKIIMSIEYKFGMDNESQWINSHKGINGARVYLNNVMLETSYLIDNNLGGSNFSIRINNDESVEFGGGVPIFENIDDRVPSEVAYMFYHTHEGMRKEPVGFKNVVPWLVAIHDKRTDSGPSKIEVDYFRIYARVNGKDIQLYSDDYDGGVFVDGGLYIRYPWFNEGKPYKGIDDYHEPMKAEINNGTLVFYPSLNSDRVWHWWNAEWSDVQKNVDYYYMEAKVRITGSALVQGGIDYWFDRNIIPEFEGNDADKHQEAGNSDWYFSTKDQNEWQIIKYSTDKVK